MPFARLRCSRLTSFAEGSEKGTRGEGNKEASLEATCKFMPISSLSGSGSKRVLQDFTGKYKQITLTLF